MTSSSMIFEDILGGGGDSNHVIFSPSVQRTSSTSYFPDFLSPFHKDSNSNMSSTFDMEGTLEFHDLAVPPSFHDFLGFDVSHPNPHATGNQGSSHSSRTQHAPSIDVEIAFNKPITATATSALLCSSPSESVAETPSSIIDEDDDESCGMNPAWERDLEKLISEFDGQVPIDEKLKEELIVAPVKEFNRRSKSMKLDGKTIQFLKLQRKRVKNRLAAIRSRSRKEIQVVDLQEQVDILTGENKNQKQTIRQLQQRLEAMEKELRRKSNSA